MFRIQLLFRAQLPSHVRLMSVSCLSPPLDSFANQTPSPTVHLHLWRAYGACAKINRLMFFRIRKARVRNAHRSSSLV